MNAYPLSGYSALRKAWHMSDSCNSAMRWLESRGAALDFNQYYLHLWIFWEFVSFHTLTGQSSKFTLMHESILFASLNILRIFVFSYTYGTIIQNYIDARFLETFSPCARAAREKHFYTLTPVLTPAHALIDFDDARILYARLASDGPSLWSVHSEASIS